MQFDHLRLVRRDLREVARYRSFLLGIQRGEVAQASIIHEANNSCCRREPWRKTQKRLIAAVLPDEKVGFVEVKEP